MGSRLLLQTLRRAKPALSSTYASTSYARRWQSGLYPSTARKAKRKIASRSVRDLLQIKDEKQISLKIDGDEESPIDPILLRDACQCPLCVDSSTSQKKFDTVDIPSELQIRYIEQQPDGLAVHWTNDVHGYGEDHSTNLSYDYLDQIFGPRVGKRKPNPIVPWHLRLIKENLTVVDYREYLTNPLVFRQALLALQMYGLIFVNNVPESEQSVIDIGTRIGPLKNTFYGYTWDVRSLPDAKNVAYTHQHLGFHMDLLYMHQPPRLQLLHCLRASTKGGASLFTDSYKTVEALQVRDMQAFLDLASLDTTFHYHNDGHHYEQRRPVIQYNDSRSRGYLRQLFKQKGDNVPRLAAVNWSPPFQGPFPVLADGPPSPVVGDHVSRWKKAAKKFRDLVQSDRAVYERQMAPGECVIFDNRRVLHARTAFDVGDVGKERWLKGAYLDSDPFESKLEALEREDERV